MAGTAWLRLQLTVSGLSQPLRLQRDLANTGTLLLGLAYPQVVAWASPFARSDSVRTLKASLVASIAATGAWMLGLMRVIWPAHPMWATFFLTIGATILLMYVLPKEEK